MRSLYLRIYLTVLAALALFALVSGWLVQRHLDEQRARFEASARERAEAWGDLLQRSLPPAAASPAEQHAALNEWSMRLRLPLALEAADGTRLATSDAYARREAEGGPLRRVYPVRMDDGRTLWVLRGGNRGAGVLRPGLVLPPGAPGGPVGLAGGFPRVFPEGLSLVLLLVLLFAAVAGGAWPVVRRLTRRLEALKQGVEAFGQGALHQRVAEDGRDEVSALGASFNRAAARIEALLQSHKSLLANASHELRSPLARLKMALSLLEDAPAEKRDALRREIDGNIAELDALVEEVLLASRLDATGEHDRDEDVDLLGVAAEEGARVGAQVEGEPLLLRGDDRLLRRALRNLLENARRYGGEQVLVQVGRQGMDAEVRVCDRGPGVPEAYRERIFEPFFRLPGHAERAGGVGLGLALVRQIAQRHGGGVTCEPRDGGGSCFSLRLPLRASARA